MEEASPRLRILFFERRRRLRRPWTLLLFGTIYLLLPFANYTAIAKRFGIPLTLPKIVFASLHPLQMALLAAPFAVGIGLLLVKRWGWWLCMLYSAILIVYNAIALILQPGVYNAGALVETILGSAAVIYFIQRDISAPYMKVYPRGWRLQKRHPIELAVRIDGQPLLTRDAGARGLYVIWPDCEKQVGDKVAVDLALGGTNYFVDGGIVRIDEGGAGIAFRGLEPAAAKSLREAIEKLSS